MPPDISPAARHDMDLVVLDRVTLGYGPLRAVKDVSGAIGKGALLALVGPNGAGKSTLLKALAGLLQPISGTIRQLGAASIAYMPQHSAIDPTFPMRVFDFVAMGLWREIGIWKPLTAVRRQRVDRALAGVGLAALGDRRIGTLSGGQLRRALFARVALQDAALILLDEPFAGIDTATAEELLGTVQAWHAEGRTVIAALHDLDQVRANFPITLLLAGRVIAWDRSEVALTNANLAAARAACQATNDDGARRDV